MSEKVKRINDNYMKGMYHGHPVKNDIHTLLIEIDALKAENSNNYKEALEWELTASARAAEITTLTTQLRVAKEALKYYAEKSHWNKSYKYQPFDLINGSDCGPVPECLETILFGGKRARQALTQIETLTKKESGE